MKQLVVELDNVKKKFKKVLALDDMNLHISRGQIYALLGHNGAGKTTTLRLILGLLTCDAGRVAVFGVNPSNTKNEVRRRIGILSEEVGLYENLSVYDNLLFYAKIYKLSKAKAEKRIDELLEIYDLKANKNDKIKGFSQGMKKKVAISRALLHDPELILLDEPSNGLDPISAKVMYDSLRDMALKKNTTIILTTHNLEQVEKICDEFTIVKQGRNIYTNTIKESFNSDFIEYSIYCLNAVEHTIVNKLLTDIHIEHFKCGKYEISVKVRETIDISHIIKKLAS